MPNDEYLDQRVNALLEHTIRFEDLQIEPKRILYGELTPNEQYVLREAAKGAREKAKRYGTEELHGDELKQFENSFVEAMMYFSCLHDVDEMKSTLELAYKSWNYEISQLIDAAQIAMAGPQLKQLEEQGTVDFHDYQEHENDGYLWHVLTNQQKKSGEFAQINFVEHMLYHDPVTRERYRKTKQ